VRQLLNAGADLASLRVRPSALAELLVMVRDGTVSHAAATRIFAIVAETGDPPAAVAKREGLVQERNADALAGWVDQVLADNPDEAARFRAGEKKLLGVLVGQVMKLSKGRADPKAVNQLLSARVAAGE
jgi:aspartyl-tRNA(Asn)/glutamyl-tRNA(Gln) amidotransferase subunit B